MADTDESKDERAGSSTPGSTTANLHEKTPKDRACPFCGQAFTSSSLGRHLDLYIKPKNPKPPDGIHDVNEIKKIRGGITRRQPRTSLNVDTKKNERRRNSNEWANSSTRSRPGAECKATDDSPVNVPRDVNDGRLHTWLNAANWQATGVINDLPARRSSGFEEGSSGQAHRVEEIRRDTASTRIQKPEYGAEDVLKLQESAELGRVAEMALREVLGSLEAAKKRAEPAPLFEDVDWFSLAFPGLCLTLLPPPPTLFSGTPFPVAHTWTMSPPGEKQKASLVRILHERITMLRDESADRVSDPTVFRHRVHLDDAYDHWSSLSENEQKSAWNLEVCRAFAQERSTTKRFKDDLEIAEQRIRHLEAEYDRLSRCQLPREYLLHPPNTVPVSPQTMREMKTTYLKSGAGDVDFDANALLNKWKAEVKAVARPPRPTLTQPRHVEMSRNEMKSDILLNGSVFGVNGAMPRDADTLLRMNTPHAALSEPHRNQASITGADEGEFDESRADAFAGSEAEESGGIERVEDHRSLMKRRAFPWKMMTDDTAINANGKRVLESSPVNGRSPGPRMYKEHVK